MSPGLVGMGGGSRLKVVGLDPGTVYWMEMAFFHIHLLWELYCFFEKTDNKQKEAGVGPFFFKKTIFSISEKSVIALTRR